MVEFQIYGLGGPDIYVAPFVDISSFHNEYEIFSASRYCTPDTVASLTTFRRAYTFCAANRGVKKLKCKGSFNTCEICNNAALLLLNKGIHTLVVDFFLIITTTR